MPTPRRPLPPRGRPQRRPMPGGTTHMGRDTGETLKRTPQPGQRMATPMPSGTPTRELNPNMSQTGRYAPLKSGKWGQRFDKPKVGPQGNVQVNVPTFDFDPGRISSMGAALAGATANLGPDWSIPITEAGKYGIDPETAALMDMMTGYTGYFTPQTLNQLANVNMASERGFGQVSGLAPTTAADPAVDPMADVYAQQALANQGMIADLSGQVADLGAQVQGALANQGPDFMAMLPYLMAGYGQDRQEQTGPYYY